MLNGISRYVKKLKGEPTRSQLKHAQEDQLNLMRSENDLREAELTTLEKQLDKKSAVVAFGASHAILWGIGGLVLYMMMRGKRS